LYHVYPLFNRVVLRFKDLIILFKRIVSRLTLNELTDQTNQAKQIGSTRFDCPKFYDAVYKQ